MAARIRDKGVEPDRLHVLPNWADLDTIRPGRRDNEIRRELGFKSEVVALYAGNLGEKQGLETVLEAAALTRGNSGLKYLIAGEGAVRARLMAQAQNLGLENLSFLPLQSKERFGLLLAAADIHLVAQRQKASDLLMPSKLTNILAAGRPFIATALPETGLGQVTLESGAGLLVPPGNPAALAQTVLALAGDPQARKRLGDRARRYAEAFLGREEILARWEDLLNDLTENRAAR
jgi:colanic acid biosynthesis glycosyl transferase WcaI